jgi:hypothetical protein
LNLMIVSLLFAPAIWAEEYIGNYSANKNNPNSTSNPYGAGCVLRTTVTADSVSS